MLTTEQCDMDNSQNSKRIAKNTLYLYVRMAVLMLVSLFTSRVVLDKLGVEDFGIYNVVGGVAVLFTFFSSSLTNASQRFLTLGLGRRDLRQTNKVFNQHLIFYALIVVGVLLLAETVGLWLVRSKLVIPADRLFAAMCVYQFTVASFCLTLLGIIFNSLIIAHEEMNVYASLSIFEGGARLGIAYILSTVHADRLILYGFLMFLVTFALQLSYMLYCLRHYAECRFRFVWDKSLLKETNALVGWNIVGTAVYAVNDSGVNILLNLFFGPAVNAARALSFQVSGAIGNLATNFFTSVQPQMMKSYAAGDYTYLMTLFYNSSKYSFLLLWMLCLPLSFTCREVLGFWLVEVPEYADVFIFWVLACSLVNSLNNPVWTVALAVGRLKRYILVGSGVSLLIFPISYVALKSGGLPVSVFMVMLVVRCVYLCVVLHIVGAYIPFKITDYLSKVVYPIGRVSVISFTVAAVLWYFVMPASVVVVISYCVTIVFVSLLVTWLCGVSPSERSAVIAALKKKLE